MNPLIDYVEKSYLKKNPPQVNVGDHVRVDVRVVEGSSQRTQTFEGTVISKRGHGLGKMFTVRKVSFGIGVERTLPIHSPNVEQIKVIRTGKVRRSKLYYLRNLSGKAARIQSKDTAKKKTNSSSQDAETDSKQKSNDKEMPVETVSHTK